MVFPLAPHGRVFSTRPLGAELLHAVQQLAADADCIKIDFEGVQQVSYSFADEFAGALVERARNSDWHGQLLFANVSPKIARVIEGSLRRRGLDIGEDASPRLVFC
jgi:anti-anti-sigma regulatory factor